MKPTIDQLEDINAILDVCIDRELYEILDEMMTFSKDGKKLLTQIEKLDSKKKWDNLKTQSIVYQMYGVSRNLPTVQVSIQPSFDGFISGIFTFKNGGNDDWFMQQWSCLFWIKAVRAVLQRKNREPWISGFDDVVVLLEANVPKVNPVLKCNKKTVEAQKKTTFAFLMELSASARDEASNGYAERARYLIPGIIGTESEDGKKRDEYGTRYDRWIWYNMGLAYQHSGLHHKAVLEFNRVISKFWNWVSNDPKSPDDPKSALEFVFAVLPCVLQRASISLQLQLGYHALQAMEESNKTNKTETWLTTLSSTQGFFAQCINNYIEQKAIFQIEALLQLERYNYTGTQDKFNEKMRTLWESKLHKKWASTQTGLPPLHISASKRPGSHVKLIEQTVAWFLQEARIKELDRRIEEIESYDKIKDVQYKKGCPRSIRADIEKLIKRIKAVKDAYWHWVEGNSFDEHIYFSEWGKFLDVTTGILEALKEHPQSELKDCTKRLLISILKFYTSKKEHMPVPRSLRKDYPESLKLENLRSDDLPDFVNGL